MNPYRHDTLLNGMLGQEDRFIGLRDELEWVLAHVSEARPSAVSLVGPVGVGKSFLLSYLAHPQGARRTFRDMIGERFRDDPDRLLFVTLDFSDAEVGKRAAANLVELLYNRALCELAGLLAIPEARLLPLDRIAEARTPTVAALRALAQQQLAHAREEADDAELRARFEATLGARAPEALLALLGCLDAWGLRVVFLIDDFDRITSALSRADFDHLRTLLAAASLVIVTRKALSRLVPTEIQTSPFFNLVQRLDLRSLYFWPLEEARRMITEPPKWLKQPPPLQFSASDVKFILELTGLHPDLIRTLCEELYMRYRRRTPTPGGDVLPGAERSLLRAQLGTLFADSFAALWHHLPEAERAALQHIAAGRVTVEDSLTPSLNAVINLGYIVCEQGRYQLFSGLFHDYVIEQTGTTPNPAPAPVKVQLTELEKKLLLILEARQGETVERDEIIAALYDVRPTDGDPRTHNSRLDALIFRLRGKLESGPQQIESIRGQGYRLVAIRG
ncbi:MAG: winged helix-turn-helix domain-containing protein [Roseiflexaceae bacterium]